MRRLFLLLPLTVGLTVFKVPEGKNYLPARMPLLPGLRLMWGNGPFKRLLAAFFINQLGSAISTALIVFYIRGVLQDEQNSILQLLVYYGFNLMGIPFWVRFSGSVGKHRAWCLALMGFSVLMLGYLLLGAGDENGPNRWQVAVDEIEFLGSFVRATLSFDGGDGADRKNRWRFVLELVEAVSTAIERVRVVVPPPWLRMARRFSFVRSRSYRKQDRLMSGGSTGTPKRRASSSTVIRV